MKLAATHFKIKTEVARYLQNEISAAELKHVTAPCGVYQQRNDLFMARIRITGGHLPLAQAALLTELMQKYALPFAHFTSRQDIQLHDVQPADIYPILRSCTENGLPCKGGGSDTYRNLVISSDSGLSPDEAFDVLPCAMNLDAYILDYAPAFALPRKLKLAFSAADSDVIGAVIQDLGFIAEIRDGARGFTVYGGGGMGRESRVGMKLFDFLPEAQVARCAQAMVNLFHDHGDRENRSKARLRFVLERLGDSAFLRLFQQYFDRSDAVLPNVCQWQIDAEIEKLQKKTLQETDTEEYRDWKKLAVSPTRFNEVVTVRLFVPQGNLSALQLQKITELAKGCGCSFLRVTQQQDVLLPIVHQSMLPFVFSFLKDKLGEIDLQLHSFKGHLLTCIGASVCKIGVVNSLSLADRIAEHLDQAFLEQPERRNALALKILDAVRISGCPNACSGHPRSAIGVQGRKKRINGSVEIGGTLFVGGRIRNQCGKLADSDGTFIRLDEIPEAILNLFLDLNLDPG